MKSTGNARRLRREQTREEKQLWQALRGRRFAGFKFRRQHPVESYSLDFYCVEARLSVELDGAGHGFPGQSAHDKRRKEFLAEQGIEELRFWNHQWNQNRAGVLLEIWEALQRRTGILKSCVNEEEHRFMPPKRGEFVERDRRLE